MPRLVRQDDRLNAVAQAELAQDARDVALHRRLADEQLARDLRVRHPARDQPQHLELARAEFLGRGGLIQAGRRVLAVVLDQPPGDRRREQRLAGGDRAHRAGQLLAVGVLEQEAGGARLHRPVDVLVEVERREHQDAGPRVGAARAGGRLDAVELRHADVHEQDVRVVGAGGCERVDPVAGLGRHLDVGLGLEHHPQPLAHEVLVVCDDDADHWTGSDAFTVKPPPGRGSARSSPPSSATRSCMPARPWPLPFGSPPAPSSDDVDPQLVRVALQAHHDVRVRPGVLERVRQRLLHDPVGRQVDRGLERGAVAVDLEVDAQPCRLDALDELGQLRDAGLGRERRRIVVAQHAEHPPHLDERLAAAALDLLQRGLVAARLSAGARACSTTTLRLCETTSCSSRAIRARSSVRAASAASASAAVSRRLRTTVPASHAPTAMIRKKRARPDVARAAADDVVVLNRVDRERREHDRQPDQRSPPVRVGRHPVRHERPDDDERDALGRAPGDETLDDDRAEHDRARQQRSGPAPRKRQRHREDQRHGQPLGAGHAGPDLPVAREHLDRDADADQARDRCVEAPHAPERTARRPAAQWASGRVAVHP